MRQITKNNINMKCAVKIFSVLLIQILLFGDVARCAAEYSSGRRPETLSPQLTLGLGEFQQVVSAYVGRQGLTREWHNPLVPDAGDSAPVLNAAEQKPEPEFKEFLKKKAVDIGLFILLHTDNRFIRRLACRVLVNLEDERSVRILRFLGIREEAVRKNGLKNKRAQKALVDLYTISRAKGKSLPLKRALFRRVNGSSDNSVKSRMAQMLDFLPMTSDEDLDDIIQWLIKDSWFLFSKAVTRINEMGPRRLAKLREKGVIEIIVSVSSTQQMTQPIFLKTIRALEKLGAEEKQIMKVCRNCLRNEDNGPVARREAALLLGKAESGGHKALETLLTYGLNDEAEIARLGAIEALGMLGDAGAIPSLGKRFEMLLGEIMASRKADLEWEKEYALLKEVLAGLGGVSILGQEDIIRQRYAENITAIAQAI